MIRSIGYAAPDKEADARHLGADDVVLSPDKEAMSKHELSGFILDTIPVSHDINPYVNLFLTLVGALEPLAPMDNSQVAFHRLDIAGSLIGSIAET